MTLVSAGVAGAESIGGVFYFTNAFDTSTDGVDLVATYPLEWSNGSSTTLTASANYNATKFDSDPSTYLNAENTYDFTHADPKFRGVITAKHEIGQFALLGRANYYGSYVNSNTGGSPLQYQTFPSIWQFDLEGTYAINDMVSVAVGGRNITDKYPAKDNIGDYCCGRYYDSGSVVDWQGSYYYMKLNASF